MASLTAILAKYLLLGFQISSGLLQESSDGAARPLFACLHRDPSLSLLKFVMGGPLSWSRLENEADRHLPWLWRRERILDCLAPEQEGSAPSHPSSSQHGLHAQLEQTHWW